MKIDMNSFMNSIKEQTPDSNYSGNTSEYRVFYPFAEGYYKFRIFWNPKGGCVQHRIFRHKTDEKKNIACMTNYGKDCPVCNAVKEVENALGKDTGVRRKYGYTERGICFAQVVDAPKSVLDENKFSKGDIVILMYPKTVMNAINTILQQAIEANKIDDVISNNTGYVIALEHGKSNPTYTANISFETYKSFATDAEFEDKISSLPNIREQVIPTEITDDVYNSSRALAESIKAEYFNSSVSNPSGNDNPFVSNQSKFATVNETFSNATPIEDEPDEDELPFDEPTVENNVVDNAVGNVTPTTPSVPNAPTCYGHYEAGAKKCLLCQAEIECSSASK